MPGRQSSSRTLRSRNRHCRPRQSTALDRLPMNDHALRGRGNDAHVRCPRGHDRHHLNARQRLRAYEPVRSRDCGLGRTLLPEARTRLSQRARGSLRSSGPMCLVRSASVFGTNREGVAAASLRRRRIRRSRKTDRKKSKRDRNFRQHEPSRRWKVKNKSSAWSSSDTSLARAGKTGLPPSYSASVLVRSSCSALRCIWMASENAAARMPVGIAIRPMPVMAVKPARMRPSGVIGKTSP